FGAKPPSSPTLVLWPASCSPFFNAAKTSEPMRTPSASVPAPIGWIMNSWMSMGLSACTPPFDVHHRHRQDTGIDAADVAEQRQIQIDRRGLRNRQRHGQSCVGAKARLVGRAVQVDQHLIDPDLLHRVHAADGVENLTLDMADRLPHALAAITGRIAVP